jgi:hypothetical protein
MSPVAQKSHFSRPISDVQTMKTAVAVQIIFIVWKSKQRRGVHHDFFYGLLHCSKYCVGLGPIIAPQFLILLAQLCILAISDCWIHLGRNMAAEVSI